MINVYEEEALERAKKQHAINTGIPKEVLFGEPKECTMECDTHEPKCRWGAYIKFLQERNKVLSERASFMRMIERADFRKGLAYGMAIPPIAYMFVMFLVRIFG